MFIQSAIVSIFNLMKDVFDKLGTVSIDLGLGNVSLTTIILSFIIVSMVISVFWKGAKG